MAIPHSDPFNDIGTDCEVVEDREPRAAGMRSGEGQATPGLPEQADHRAS